MLLETTGLDIAKYVVIVFQILVCLLLILVVMMQRPKQEGLGAAFGGDTMDSLTGAHATDFLQKGTAFLGTLLFVLTFLLSILVISGASEKNKSLANTSEKAPPIEATSPDAAEAIKELLATDTEEETTEASTPEIEKTEAPAPDTKPVVAAEGPAKVEEKVKETAENLKSAAETPAKAKLVEEVKEVAKELEPTAPSITPAETKEKIKEAVESAKPE